jgi:hypothetical protein
VKPLYRRRRLWAHRIRHRKGGECPVILCEVDNALGALSGLGRERLNFGGHSDPVAIKKVGTSNR